MLNFPLLNQLLIASFPLYSLIAITVFVLRLMIQVYGMTLAFIVINTIASAEISSYFFNYAIFGGQRGFLM